MPKKIPMRKCLATNQSFPKKELIRIVKTPLKEVKVDLSGKLNGKGAYLSKNHEALEKAKAKRLLERALEIEVNAEIYEELLKIIDEK